MFQITINLVLKVILQKHNNMINNCWGNCRGELQKTSKEKVNVRVESIGDDLVEEKVKKQ
jgi:hypothetical protein